MKNNKKVTNFWDDAQTQGANILLGLVGFVVILSICVAGMVGL